MDVEMEIKDVRWSIGIQSFRGIMIPVVRPDFIRDHKFACPQLFQ